MSHNNPKYVAVNKVALVNLLQTAEMCDDFHELRHAAEQVRKSMIYNEQCVELERRDTQYCPARE